MMDGFDPWANRLALLKKQALLLIDEKSHGDPMSPGTQVEVTQLLEDLRIYQVELELQNEELRRTQQDAELSNARYQSLFEQLPLPTFVVDVKGLIQRCNEYGHALLGAEKSFSPSDNRLFQRLRKDDRTRLHVALRDLLSGQSVIIPNLELASSPDRVVFDAHLIRLSHAYHLDGHAMILLVDRSAEVAREQDRHFYSLLLDSSDALIYAADQQGNMLVANQAFLSVLGRRREEVLGRPRDRFLQLREALDHRSSDEKVIASGESLTMEESIFTGNQDGTLAFLTRKFPLRDLDGKIIAVAGISTDITAVKAQQRQAVLSESVFITASEAILITDKDNRIIRINPAFTAMSGFSEAAVMGRRPNLLKSGRQDAAFFAEMWKALNDHGKWAGEICNRAADGHLFTVWCSINAIHDERGNVSQFMAIQTDVTLLREAQTRVAHLASYDSLTGLPNRALFNDRIKVLISHARRYRKTFAVLFVDLDHFKEVNDSLGHQVGDDLLKVIAQRLQDCVRSEDTVARMGGDEFVVLLLSTDSETARLVADKVLDTLRMPLALDKLVEYQPQASIGIAVYPEHGEDTDILLRNADIAMYAAKFAGRNRSSIYSAQMSADNERVFAIQTELTNGIERQELRLYFQPKFRLDNGALDGAEALVRWERPGAGLLLPAEFIPIAEKSGLVVAIDRWVLKEAMRQIADWIRLGLWQPTWRVSVNHSASDLRRPAMLDELVVILSESDTTASMLEIEITASTLLENTADMIGKLTALKALGVSLAIDDFGTGFSSMSYLTKLPISVIKIDRSFINDMLVNERDHVLVETIIAMAHKLGHDVVAEGVEQTAQQDRLARLGCEVGQGYLFGRPVSADLFAATYLHGTKHSIDVTGLS